MTAPMLLVGYHVPSSKNEKEETGRFKLKACKHTTPGVFRSAFPDDDPPFPFTWVTENVFTGALVPVPGKTSVERERHPVFVNYGARNIIGSVQGRDLCERRYSAKHSRVVENVRT